MEEMGSRKQLSLFRVLVVYTRSQPVNRFGFHVASFVFSTSGFRIKTCLPCLAMRIYMDENNLSLQMFLKKRIHGSCPSEIEYVGMHVSVAIDRASQKALLLFFICYIKTSCFILPTRHFSFNYIPCLLFV